MKHRLVVLAALLLPLPAAAFSNSFRAANADNVSGTTPVFESAIAMTVLQCQSTGCQGVIHGVMPSEITGAHIGFNLRVTSPDVSPSGRGCYQICAEVVKSGQRLDLANFASCTGYTNTPLAAQWVVQDNNFGSITIVPQDANGGVCTGPAGANPCGGSELYLLLQKNAVGACTSGSSNTEEFTSLTVTFQ